MNACLHRTKNKTAKCNFCGKPAQKVSRLLFGRGAYICDECVMLCYQMLVSDGTIDDFSHHVSKPRQRIVGQSLPKPMEIKAVLDEYVVGQEEAKILAVSVYNHYKRILNADNENDVELQKSNVCFWTYRRGKNHACSDLSESA